ncbi:MAG: YhfC family intramembrane metalloprotease [Planctomycetales bacterium]|nr:YhfC family intramembrane metalloprotease [Planctomycetales bacterium]
MDPLVLMLVSPIGMIAAGVAAVVFWRREAQPSYRWFWIGAALWTVAVAVKFAIAIPANGPVVNVLNENVSHPMMVLLGGLFIGVESSLTEIGFTLAAVMIWRQLGQDSNRAIAIGLGAGAFEAVLLGALSLIGLLVALSGIAGTEGVEAQLMKTSQATPLIMLVGPVERLIAIACHASSRALVLLGFVHRRVGMVLGGFAIFTLIDAIAGGAHLTGKLGEFSVWWIELMILPCALISLPILAWCHRKWGSDPNAAIESTKPD